MSLLSMFFEPSLPKTSVRHQFRTISQRIRKRNEHWHSFQHVDLPVNVKKFSGVGLYHVTFFPGPSDHLTLFVYQPPQENASAINCIEDIVISALASYTEGVKIQQVMALIQTPNREELGKAVFSKKNMVTFEKVSADERAFWLNEIELKREDSKQLEIA